MNSKDYASRFPVAEKRATEGVSQTCFWGRYGVDQSGGSRYERMRWLPRPLIMLIWLHWQGRLSDKDLAAALAASAQYRPWRRRQPRVSSSDQ